MKLKHVLWIIISNVIIPMAPNVIIHDGTKSAERNCKYLMKPTIWFVDPTWTTPLLLPSFPLSWYDLYMLMEFPKILQSFIPQSLQHRVRDQMILPYISSYWFLLTTLLGQRLATTVIIMLEKCILPFTTKYVNFLCNLSIGNDKKRQI